MKNCQKGFTLIEFLVAAIVTVAVLAIALGAMNDSLRANQNVSQMADLSDNLRVGMNMAVQDLVQTGTGIPTGGIPIPNNPNGAGTCNTAAPMNRPGPSNGAPLQFPGCNFVLPAIEPGQGLGPQVTSPDGVTGINSDIVTVLYADYSVRLDQTPVNRPASAGVAACNGTISGTGDVLTFDANCMNLATANAQINPGDLIMFSNVNGNALQTVTSAVGQTLRFDPGDAFNLNGRNEPQGTIVQLQTNGAFPPTTATRVWMVTYYLDTTADPVHPRLVRQVNFNPPQPVAESMENLQATYNYVDGVTNPANQPDIPAGFSENEIRAVNLTIRARSDRHSSTSQYLRSNLTTQVSLRSMAYVNRYN